MAIERLKRSKPGAKRARYDAKACRYGGKNVGHGIVAG